MARAPRSMSEWRRSPATGDWHVNAPERAHPAALRAGPPAPGATAFACPYCPGAEQLVAAALLEEADAQGTWLSRVVPSARPALRVEEPEAAPVDGPGHYGLRASTPGLGAHEIVVESRQHDLDLFDYAPADFARMLRAWRARMRDLSRDSRLKSAVPLRERLAGRGDRHPCSELLALPHVPPLLARELYAAAEYRRVHGRCLHCALVDESGARLVARDDEVAALCPFASTSPFETWVMPGSHSTRFEHASDAVVDAAARLLARVVARMGIVLGRPAVRLWLHSAPLQEGDRDDFHWHVEIHPRIGPDDGWLAASGVAVNVVAPETAANWLNDGDEGTP